MSSEVIVIGALNPQSIGKLDIDKELTRITPMPAKSIDTIRFLVTDYSMSIRGFFLTSNLPNWLEAIKEFHQKRPGVPIFLVTNEKEAKAQEITYQDIQNLGIRKSLNTPIDFKRMVEEVAPLAAGFDINSAIEAQKKNQDSLDQETEQDDENFSAIRADNFLSASKSIFDVYVRLSSKKYLKILQAGDNFDEDRLNQYLKKGVTHFYIHKDVQQTYVDYCEHLTKKILANKSIPKEVKVAQTLNFGQETMSFLKNNGITEKELAVAKNFVSTVDSLFKQFNPKKENLLKEFINDLAAYDHGVSTTMIASMLAEDVGLESKYATEILGLAALMHDIGLVKMPAECQTEDISKMSEEQKALYEQHPKIGAEALSKIPTIAPAIPQAIEQHHVRRNKQGFPTVASVGKMNRVAEIIGISSEFTRLIEKAKQEPKFDPFSYMEKEVYNGFSRPIVQSFQNTFTLKTLV